VLPLWIQISAAMVIPGGELDAALSTEAPIG